jgi:hypothetical protein
VEDRGSGRWWVGGAACALALVASGCGDRHPERTPEGALHRLRDALVTGNPPIARVSDTRVIYEASVLTQSRGIEQHSGLQFSDNALDQMLRDLSHPMDPQQAFAGVAPMLRQGHCEKLADAPLPPEIHTTPEPGEHWQARAMALQVSVARRLTNAFAADFRCDGGPSFRAVFVHGDPDDGALRVAQISGASVR